MSFFHFRDGFFLAVAQCEVKASNCLGSSASPGPKWRNAMPKRGKVLRDPYGGPGLLMVEGKQYPFLMERQWRSDVPAKPGLMVDVDFDTKGNLHSITAISEHRLCTEQGGARGTPERDTAVSQ